MTGGGVGFGLDATDMVGGIMPLRLFLFPIVFGLAVLAIITAGDALFWSVPHALDRLPPRVITVAVLVALWVLRGYKRINR